MTGKDTPIGRVLVFADLKPTRGIPWSQGNISRLEGLGKFPRRVKLNGRVAWLEAEIDAWLAEQVAARDAETAKTPRRRQWKARLDLLRAPESAA